MEYECLTLLEMRDNIIIGEKFFFPPVPLCLSQIRHSVTRDTNRPSAVRGWRESVRSVPRPARSLLPTVENLR